jgi:predicted nucleotidyltransferase
LTLTGVEKLSREPVVGGGWQDGFVGDDMRWTSGWLATTASEVASQLSVRRDVDAILLYGSVARGDADRESDIDLLIVGRDAGQTVASLRRWVGSVDPDHRASYVFHTRESFAELVEEGSRFLVHLRTEGQILLDRTGQLTAFLCCPWQPVSVEAEIGLALERLQNYERPEIFGGRFLFALAHVFTIGKAIVMARLADEGHVEFNRQRAFEAFMQRHPDEAGDASLIAGLEPFVARTRRRGTVLPFSPAGALAADRLQEGVAAVRRLAQMRSRSASS